MSDKKTGAGRNLRDEQQAANVGNFGGPQARRKITKSVPVASPSSSASTRQLLHVLIVEDSPTDAELMVHELHRSGFDVAWRRVDNETDYLAQLELLQEIVLADYALPNFSGQQALQLPQQQGLSVPFVVVSGTIGEEAAAAVIKQGATDYVLKSRLGRLGPVVMRALQAREK